jgi:hypothetical protein
MKMCDVHNKPIIHVLGCEDCVIAAKQNGVTEGEIVATVSNTRTSKLLESLEVIEGLAIKGLNMLSNTMEEVRKSGDDLFGWNRVIEEMECNPIQCTSCDNEEECTHFDVEITPLRLKKLGFSVVDKEKDIYSMRIHVLTYLHMNIRLGFASLVRYSERALKDNMVEIIIPKPMKTIKQLSHLIEIIGNK